MMTNAKPIDAVAHGIRWRKLNRPKRWQPKKPGTELVGVEWGLLRGLPLQHRH